MHWEHVRKSATIVFDRTQSLSREILVAATVYIDSLLPITFILWDLGKVVQPKCKILVAWLQNNKILVPYEGATRLPMR